MIESLTKTEVAATLVVGYFAIWAVHRWNTPNLDHIPAVGYWNPLLSYLDAMKFSRNPAALVERGIQRFKGAPFKIALMRRWLVVIVQPDAIEDIRKAGDVDLSFINAGLEVFQTRQTFGEDVVNNRYHVGVIRNPLTRALNARFDDVLDEVQTAFEELLPPTTDWKPINTISLIPEIVSRTSNRLFVSSEELCRNEDYKSLNVTYSFDVISLSNKINEYPACFRPMINWVCSSIEANLTRAVKHLTPVIEDRLAKEEQYGEDWPDKPNDLITWLLNETSGEERSIRNLANRVLVINFGAIHTTSLAFNHAIYHLAADPSCLRLLRKEIEEIVADEGVTSHAVKRMRRLDSFLRETARINFGNLAMNRQVVSRKFTFSDGLVVPKGTYLSVGVRDTSNDPFDPFYYSRIREESADADLAKYQFTTCNVDYLTFGHGKHSCPGRFFAAQQLKLMLVHVVSTYDVRFAEEGVRPPNEWVGLSRVPNPRARVLFRKRNTV